MRRMTKAPKILSRKNVCKLRNYLLESEEPGMLKEVENSVYFGEERPSSNTLLILREAMVKPQSCLEEYGLSFMFDSGISNAFGRGLLLDRVDDLVRQGLLKQVTTGKEWVFHFLITEKGIQLWEKWKVE